ncbi:hypothetical protein SFA35_11900 [Pseudomonas sp. HR96]|uniref:hypothetical protein n=1 Tax=Pseudomonas sp. HR96 TaxID=1027966 RepID=UPI002A74BC07|nr:hypothetical protein [Pseudomonas sp. HR96]WPP02008.1 hypothetical protein SFA35_11900 [Pseudomonas sp. HR96]
MNLEATASGHIAPQPRQFTSIVAFCICLPGMALFNALPRSHLPMSPWITRLFNGLEPKVHIVWLALFLAYPIADWIAGEPVMIDRPLARSEGRITWVDNQRNGYKLLIRADDAGEASEQLFIWHSRSLVHSPALIASGQKLKVERYGNAVANCWVGDTQVCFARCSSELQCQQQEHASDRWLLPGWMAVTLFGYLFTLAWVACGGQIFKTPHRPGR